MWHRPWPLPVVVVHNSLKNNGVPPLLIVAGLLIFMVSDDGNVCSIYCNSTHWIASFSKSVHCLLKTCAIRQVNKPFKKDPFQRCCDLVYQYTHSGDTQTKKINTFFSPQSNGKSKPRFQMLSPVCPVPRGGVGQKFGPGLFGPGQPTTIHTQILCHLPQLMYTQTHKLLITPLY